MGYNFVKGRKVNKRIGEKIQKMNEFPKVECKKEIVSPEDGETVLVEVGDVCEISRTEKKGYYRVLRDKGNRGVLLLSGEEVREYFEVEEKGLKIEDCRFKRLGFEIVEK